MALFKFVKMSFLRAQRSPHNRFWCGRWQMWNWILARSLTAHVFRWQMPQQQQYP